MSVPYVTLVCKRRVEGGLICKPHPGVGTPGGPQSCPPARAESLKPGQAPSFEGEAASPLTFGSQQLAHIGQAHSRPQVSARKRYHLPAPWLTSVMSTRPVGCRRYFQDPRKNVFERLKPAPSWPATLPNTSRCTNRPSCQIRTRPNKHLFFEVRRQKPSIHAA